MPGRTSKHLSTTKHEATLFLFLWDHLVEMCQREQRILGAVDTGGEPLMSNVHARLEPLMNHFGPGKVGGRGHPTATVAPWTFHLTNHRHDICTAPAAPPEMECLVAGEAKAAC